jgi:bleomycin hydrolase
MNLIRIVKQSLLIISLLLVFVFGSVAQETGYKFEVVKILPSTPVKDQYRSGTCWSFSAVSFYESELLRIGKGEYDISEMYVVRNSYYDKAVKYVRVHGNLSFSQGGGYLDVGNSFRDHGMVPESAYPGLNYGTDKHVHGELENIFKAFVAAVVENKNKTLSTAWKPAFDGMLDAYFGKKPETFMYNGKEYTPQSFSDDLGLDMNDYVAITSYTHHPFYEPFILEIPDNWAWDQFYNVKMEDLTKIMDHSINKGYTLIWGADVSDKGFDWSKGLAVVPNDDVEEMDGLEKAKWEDASSIEKSRILYDFSEPRKEKTITQELRQERFDNYTTTDDHGLHVIGISKDQNGTEYYKVKNSWNTNNPYEGFFYLSKAYVKLNTMAIVVNKNAIPSDIRKKLGL